MEMDIKRLLANPTEEIVFDHPLWRKPEIGDKVEIVSWDEQTHVQECVRLSHLPFLVVSDVIPFIVGNGVFCYWAYKIGVEGSNVTFLQWNYKILNI